MAANGSLFECPDCGATQPESGTCGRCPSETIPVSPHERRERVRNETIGAMRVALIAAQTVVDPAVHPKTSRLIEAALSYEATHG